MGGSYVNDFIDRGRVKKVYVMSKRNTVCCRMISATGMFVLLRSDGAVLGILLFSLGVRFAALERYNGLPSMEILGQAAPGKVPVKQWS